MHDLRILIGLMERGAAETAYYVAAWWELLFLRFTGSVCVVSAMIFCPKCGRMCKW